MQKNNIVKLKNLENALLKLYKKHSKKLLFHGWHHINFVRNKALQFGKPIKADLFIVESAALTHDLNYIVKVFSKVEEGSKLRKTILRRAGYTNTEIKRIESIIRECETATRGSEISTEGKAVSDADTLYKALPITPVVFAGKYIAESKIDIQTLANKIVKDQRKLLDQGIYFYTKSARIKYIRWARQQIELWESVKEALADKDVKEVLKTAKDYSVL